MDNRGKYLKAFLLCVVVALSTVFMPESMGDTRPLIFFIGVLIALVFLIAVIVSSIRAKRQARRAKDAPAVAPEPTSAPVPRVPVESTPAHVPAVPMESTPKPAPAPKKATKIERVHVRGVSYYTDNIKAVATENSDYSLTKRELGESFEGERVYKYEFFVKADLVPEPENEHDPNAIMVTADGLCIGHVPAGSTAHIRKLMESGRIKRMELNIGGGRYKEVYEDDDGKFELSTGDLNYSAVLELYLTEEQEEMP